jgi:Fe-Mn family superoxide dismutase
MNAHVNRRTALGAALAAGALHTTQETAMAQASHPPSPYEVRPLPFDPARIPGFSERILASHHDSNYAGAVNRIGAIQAQLAQLDPATAPGFLINGLKREELLAMNSMILHEIYFSCLGSGGSRPGGQLARRIECDFGSHERWSAEFVGMGKALGGGSGWVLLTWSPRAGRLLNQWAFDHTMTLADGDVLVALDMYEHAYHMDFGARAGDYINAFMRALSWSEADRRFQHAAAERG